MAKRLFELAKDFGVKDIKGFIEELHQQGFDIKDHLSVVDEPLAEKIAAYVQNRQSGGVQEKRISSTVKRRRRKVRTAPKPEPIPDVTAGVKAQKPEPVIPKPKKEEKPMETPPARQVEMDVSAPKQEDKEPIEDIQPVEEATQSIDKTEEMPTPTEDVSPEPEDTVKQEVEAQEGTEDQVVPEASDQEEDKKVEPTVPSEESEKQEEPPKPEPLDKKTKQDKTPKEKKPKRRPRAKTGRHDRPIPVMKGLKIISTPDPKEVAELAARRAREKMLKAQREEAARTEEERKKAGPTRGKKGKAYGDDEKYQEKRAEKKHKKGRRVIYDKSRDVISIHDIDSEQIEEFKPAHRSLRKKKSKEKKKFAKTKVIQPKAEKRVIKVEGDSITVGEISQRMGVRASEVIKKLMSMGVMAGVSQALDLDTAEILATEFQYTVEKIGFNMEEALGLKKKDKPESLKPRPPVVTVMGHVDHGKTTLLDYIRKSDITGHEAGKITQHIGAYVLDLEEGRIIWLDTPGHEAFTAMRARGALATDIVVLVVAADDGVKAQTIEAINHAKDAGVPVIVAVNKIDKPTAQPDMVKKQLADYQLIPEEWGGDTIFINVSAKTGVGVKALLDAILLQAEVSELKANPDKPANGVVVESSLDDKKGPVATLLVKEGTLRKGDIMVAGITHGRVRMMMDDRGRSVKEAGPSIPVQVAGWDEVPRGSERFYVVPDEKTAREVIDFVKSKTVQTTSKAKKMSLEDLFAMAEKGELKEFKIVLKTDVQGSLDAVRHAIEGLKNDKIKPVVIHAGVGEVTSNDINLASAAGAVVLTFNVGMDSRVSKLANQEKVQVRTYNVIYELLDDLKKAMQGELAPEINLVLSGKAEVRQVFNLSKAGTVAGCMVTEGKVIRGGHVKVLRDNKIIAEDSVAALKRFKDTVKEVSQGYECGISLEHFDEYKEGDIMEFYRKEEVEQRL